MESFNRIHETENRFIDELQLLGDDSSVCEYLMLTGMSHPEKTEIRTDEYRIPNCKSVIWCQVKLKGDAVDVSLDSDSFLIKGILSMIEKMYAGSTRDEIKSNPIRFLDFISDRVLYSEIRTNGLLKCYMKMTGESQ